MELSKKMIEELNERFQDDSNINWFEHSVEEWLELGKPRMWKFCEKDGDLSVFVDMAFGRLALFSEEKLIGDGKFEVTSKVAVVLDKDYYGTSKYIWK